MALSGGLVNREHWQTIKNAFSRAQELPPPQQEAFLESLASRSPELVEEVRRLLRSEADARDFLEPPEPDKLERPLRLLSFDFTGYCLGEFELVRVIGRGASGVVYLGRQASLGRDVAIKILSPHLCHSPERRERFRREALAASKIRHPNVVSVLSFGEQDGANYIVMELVRGQSLHDEIERALALRDGEAADAGGRLAVTDPLVAARIIEGVALGLGACHCAGVIHRDIKPQNILIDEQGIPRIVDFGLAKDEELEGLSDTGSLSGTPHYMSPEQASASGRGVDCRTDVYSAGAVLYEMLCLRRPFEAAGTPDVLQRILHDKPIPVHHVRPEVPRSLAGICMKALNKRPDQRYASADGLAHDLHEFLEGHVAVPNLRWMIEDRASAVVRKHPWLPAVGAIAAVGVLIAITPRASVSVEARSADGITSDLSSSDTPDRRPHPIDEQERRAQEGQQRIHYLESLFPDKPPHIKKDN
jgi:serine/threonine protein kinase